MRTLCMYGGYKIGSPANGRFTLPDPDSDPHADSDSCTMQIL